MKNGEFTIKELSDMFSQTRGAIRFYEEKGLINPRRDENCFRYYSIDDVLQLFYLKHYSEMSVPLDDVFTYFTRETSYPLSDISAYLESLEHKLDDEIAQLQQTKQYIEGYHQEIEECQHPVIRYQDCPDYYCFPIAHYTEPYPEGQKPYTIIGDDQIRRYEESVVNDPEVLGRLIQASPASNIQILIMETEDRIHFFKGISISKDVAQECGLKDHPQAIAIPASRTAITIMRFGDALDQISLPMIYQKFCSFRQELIDLGEIPHLFMMSSLIFTHMEDGPIQYSRLYVPLLDQAKNKK